MRNLIILVLMILLTPTVLKVKAEAFTWPSDGYLGWRFYEDTNGQDASGIPVEINGSTHRMHTGIDIWSNSDGGWNNGQEGQSNAVYSSYAGQVYYVDYLGLQIKHSDTLYTNYWHLRNIQVSPGNQVNTSSLLGYQDNGQGVVHVHVTVTTAPMEGQNHDNTGTIDPSPYFGVELDTRNSNVVSWGTQFQHIVYTCPTGSNITIINRNITGTVNCSASNSILILPETSMSGEQNYFIQ